jgi:hypothetical protein
MNSPAIQARVLTLFHDDSALAPQPAHEVS